jgi:hypothetical protein
MKYGVEMASGGMIYIPDFKKLISGCLKLLSGDTYRYTDTRHIHSNMI